LEIRRGDGPWLMPTLEGEPRLVKPPLTAWISAAALRPSTVRDFGSHDERVRSNAFDRLVRECRWASLLSACVMLLFVFELGRVLGGWQVGVAAVLVCASTLLFLRQGRRATTDLQLAVWVTAANTFLAKLVF